MIESLASYGTFGAKAVVNAPIVEGTLAMKVFGFHNDTDGYYRDGNTGAPEAAATMKMWARPSC